MDPGSFLVVAAIFLLVALFISRPFWEDSIEVSQHPDDRHSHLLAERERLLTAIEELDFDHQLGKVSEILYQHRRRRLIEAGGVVMKELEQYGDHARLRGEDHQTRPAGVEDDDLEELISARRSEILESEHRFCPQCGYAVREMDQFCANCGTGLRQ